jgi:GNAT superfamily N-acetyltransferase
MLEYLSYVLCFGLLLVLVVYIYIRLKYGFWVVQPVFHVYDVGYMLSPPGIIDDTPPQPNKYTNFKDIDTTVFGNLTSIQQQRLTQFIRLHYLQNKDNVFRPQANNVLPYFIGHNDKSFATFYYHKDLMLDLKKGTSIDDRRIIGMITARPLDIFITKDRASKQPAQFKAYYVDYLCVDKQYRKQGIAPQLIQTHYYNQRHVRKEIVVSLFKREEELTGIVPMCVYSTYGFSVDTWTKPPDFSGPYKLLEINQQNFRYLYDFVRVNSNKFDIVISVAMQNVIELIKTKNVFIYAVVCDEQIVCCYFFRKSCVEIQKGMEVLTCFASVCGACEEDMFVQGFKISFWKIAAENYFGFAAIENVSHNDIILRNITMKTKPTITSPTAYFFYNFAYPTFASNKVLIIN